MGCGCGCDCCDCPTTGNIVTALQVTNSWNVPSCGASAVLSVVGLTVVMVGSYVYNPTYGSFRITAFDSVNGQITVINECLASNAPGGTVVPANTYFIFSQPPQTTNITYQVFGSGAAYTLTGVAAPVTFGVVSPSIVLGFPGTYLILANVTFYAAVVTTAAFSILSASIRRMNNTPADIVAPFVGVQPGALTAISGVLAAVHLPDVIYTTNNNNDIISLNALFTGSVPSIGSFQINAANIVAIKLS